LIVLPEIAKFRKVVQNKRVTSEFVILRNNSIIPAIIINNSLNKIRSKTLRRNA
jgi:hypothetical protein